MRKLLLFLLFFCLFLYHESNSQTKVRVKFPKGKYATTVTGTIRGYEYIDYVVRARKGQRMVVQLILLNRNYSTNFSVFDTDGLALTADTDYYDEILPATGDYVIRVLMSRSEARRKGSISRFRIRIGITD
ncbi:MAG: hypothetical protein N2Z23_04295 [Pyrinomonadaceae bacterium]|nr:hypothetical protein [Pyrinomonadaceae bacterium]MCX7639644.1 hypothetical protein [Pyrinomonadaceae bacterium]MDW8303338.1 hypothetical protein [Acidobacteriota bacterium]